MIAITDFYGRLYGSGISETLDADDILEAQFMQNMFWEGRTVVKGTGYIKILDYEEKYNIVNPKSSFATLKSYEDVKLNGYFILKDENDNTKRIDFDRWFLKEIEFSKVNKVATLHFEDVLGKFDRMTYEGYGLVKPVTVSGYYWRILNGNPYKAFPQMVSKPFLFEGTEENAGDLWCALKQGTYFSILSSLSQSVGAVLWANLKGEIMADWVTLENLYMSGDYIFPNQQVDVNSVTDVRAVVIGGLGIPSLAVKYDFDNGEKVTIRLKGRTPRFTQQQLYKTMEVMVPVDNKLFIKEYRPDKYNPTGYMFLDVDETGVASCYYGGGAVFYYIIPTQVDSLMMYSGTVEGIIPITEEVPLNQYIDEVSTVDPTLTLDFPILQNKDLIETTYLRYKNSPFRKKHIEISVIPSRLDEIAPYPCKFKVMNEDNSVAYDTILHGIRHKFKEGGYSYDAFCVLV